MDSFNSVILSKSSNSLHFQPILLPNDFEFKLLDSESIKPSVVKDFSSNTVIQAVDDFIDLGKLMQSLRKQLADIDLSSNTLKHEIQSDSSDGSHRSILKPQRDATDKSDSEPFVLNLDVTEEFIYYLKDSALEKSECRGVVQTDKSNATNIDNMSLRFEVVITDAKNAIVSLLTNNLFIKSPISVVSENDTSIRRVVVAIPSLQNTNPIQLLRYSVPSKASPDILRARCLLTPKHNDIVAKTNKLLQIYRISAQIVFNSKLTLNNSIKSLKLQNFNVLVSLSEINQYVDAVNVANANNSNTNSSSYRSQGVYNPAKMVIMWSVVNASLDSGKLELDAEILLKSKATSHSTDNKEFIGDGLKLPKTLPISVKCVISDTDGQCLLLSNARFDYFIVPIECEVDEEDAKQSCNKRELVKGILKCKTCYDYRFT